MYSDWMCCSFIDACVWYIYVIGLCRRIMFMDIYVRMYVLIRTICTVY